MRKKIFTFLLALAASVGMFATTEVTITQNDFPINGENVFTKDGVTVSAGIIEGLPGNLINGVSFSTTLGNFTQIEVNAQLVNISGEGLSGSTWTGNASSVSFSGDIWGNGTQVTLKFTIGEPAPAGPIPCTAADRGKVLCTDGSIYATVSEATAASKTAAAVIAYVDTENGKALALALANESGTMDWETAKTTAAAHTPAVSGGTWTLASKDDWDHMINAAGGYNALRDGFSGVGGTNIQKGQYWTSTEYDSGVSMVLNFGTNDGGYFIGANEDFFSVRACLAFDISAAPAPAEDVDITPNVDPQDAAVYYSTFFDSSVKYELPAGVEAYVADLSGANLLLTKIAEAGEVIPANVAVILKSTVTPFTLTVSDADAVTFTATNDLLGVDAETAAPENCYVLSGTDQYGVGFYQILGNTLKAHKAYVIYTGNAAPKRMRFVFNQTTDVESIQPSAVSIQKILENGQVIIIRNGVRYNAAGQIVK